MAAKHVKWLAWFVLTPLGVVAALALALWVWTGSANSLSNALGQLGRLLPAGHQLQVSNASGSLREGGHLDWVRWEHNGLRVEAHNIRLNWALASLWSPGIQINTLSIERLQIVDEQVRDPKAIPHPPTHLRLPLKVQAHVTIDHLQWSGTSTQSIDKIAVKYEFDSKRHILHTGQARILATNYTFSGRLQAASPMALELRAQGLVPTAVSTKSPKLDIDAQATLTGSLATQDARLTLQASLKPLLPSPQTSRGEPTAMQAQVSAEIAPWHHQPIIQAQGHWQALNLAVLWPQAPQTLLTGRAQVLPQGAAWQAQVALTNSMSGPLDKQRLPLDDLQASFGYTHGNWVIQTLQAHTGAGEVSASGQIQDELWQGQVSLRNIRPQNIDTRVSGAPLSGTVQAQQTVDGFTFEGGVVASVSQPPQEKSQPQTMAALQLQRLDAKGLWAAPQLKLEQLNLLALDAQIKGQLAYNLTTQAASAQLDLRASGFDAGVHGDLSRTQGSGHVFLHVTNAEAASRWLKRWPSIATAAGAQSLRGTAKLKAQWSGGWQDQGQRLRLEASVQTPRLDVMTGNAAAESWQLHDLGLSLSGTPSALDFAANGQARTAQHALTVHARAKAARLSADHWQASIPSLKLSLLNVTQQTTPWTLQWGTSSETQNPTTQVPTLNWQHTTKQDTITLSGAKAQLQGPPAGATILSWQPVRWSRQRATGSSQWASQGNINNLPLAWLDAFGGKTLADLGVSSSMLVSGDWDAEQTDILRARLTLERSRGDVGLLSDDMRQRVVPAGLEEAWMQVNLDDLSLSGSLRWNSARAGKALVAFSTQLQRGANGLHLPPEAPVGGSLQLNLPPMNAWSVLAPPGWRLRGTMDTNVTLTGTVARPLWDGTLRARDLAVRSVVDGIDFSQGTLDARLRDQQLDVQNFTLQGAGGSSGAGGKLVITGSIALPNSDTEHPVLSRLRMNLQAKATSLRLSSRPDRRLVMSGEINGQLQDRQLKLRGALSAEQALFTLPDDNTPQLSDDVVVRTTQKATPLPSDTAKAQASTNRPATKFTPDIEIGLDLGSDFQVRGRGVVTRLSGELTLQAKGDAPPSLHGSVRTVRGTYLAYGQRLDIEQGLLRFNGPFDNPTLAILAIRPKLSQRVGVEISGTALSPVVRLYAEPDLPDAEKLAWLVLGRSSAGGGAETALLQQAAMALLSGNGKSLSASVSEALGLDELSFKRGSSGVDTTAGGASVTLGKRLSKDFYLAYESSLTGASGVFYIFYDLSRLLTLRAQTGEQSAIDLIYTRRYD